MKKKYGVLYTRRYISNQLVQWIELPCSEEEIDSVYNEMDAKGFCDYEEHLIDWKLPFPISCSRESIKTINTMLHKYEQLNEEQKLILPFVSNHFAINLLEWLEDQNFYQYRIYNNCESIEDVKEILSEIGGLSRLDESFKHTEKVCGYRIPDEPRAIYSRDYNDEFMDYSHFYKVNDKVWIEFLGFSK